MPINRKIYFDLVRESLFSGSLSQNQVSGQNYILDEAEMIAASHLDWVVRDMRFLAYSLATTFHETDKKMLPISEYGKGEGKPYGRTDPETGQKHYGRGYVQLTWRDNYSKATKRLGLSKTPDDLEWHPDKALIPTIAADIMFQGMTEGWFRAGHTLPRYFDEDTDDPYNAREIINGDKKRVPDWSNGVSIGNLIAGYHRKFLTALTAAYVPYEEPIPPTPEPEPEVPTISVNGRIIIIYNGDQITT
jgi:putative chitinase